MLTLHLENYTDFFFVGTMSKHFLGMGGSHFVYYCVDYTMFLLIFVYVWMYLLSIYLYVIIYLYISCVLQVYYLYLLMFFHQFCLHIANFLFYNLRKYVSVLNWGMGDDTIIPCCETLQNILYTTIYLFIHFLHLQVD